MKNAFRRQRRGYVMVLLAMMLFGLFAMAAMVIDLGFARLTQRQMQIAANSAALEGLRGEGDPSMTYQDRQQAAENIVAWTFDDDLDPSNGDDGVAGDGGQFGAGPIVSFTGGAGDLSLNASQLMSIDNNNTAYKPTMIRGAAATAGQFSVHLQRGDNDSDANLYSQGPSVPYLFARGSTMNRQVIGNGITVRAESEARTVPALSVGTPVLDSSSTEVYPGAISIGYRLADWNGARMDPRIVDSAKTVIGQAVVEGATATLANGICCIYNTVSGTDRVIGFAMIRGGVVLPDYVAVANATGRLSDVWSQIDPAIRQTVRDQNRLLDDVLQVALLVERS